MIFKVLASSNNWTFKLFQGWQPARIHRRRVATKPPTSSQRHHPAVRWRRGRRRRRRRRRHASTGRQPVPAWWRHRQRWRRRQARRAWKTHRSVWPGGRSIVDWRKVSSSFSFRFLCRNPFWVKKSSEQTYDLKPKSPVYTTDLAAWNLGNKLTAAAFLVIDETGLGFQI